MLAFVSDLIFASKITGVAGHVGVPVRVVRDALDPAASKLAEVTGIASGAIIDLSLTRADPLALIGELKALRPGLPIVAFVPHVQAELARAATAAGADRVLSRSKFVEQLGQILQQLCSA